MLKPEELQRHDLNFKQQEQISRLQFHAPKKAGARPYFSGQVKRGDTHVMLKEKIERYWVYDNFDPRFVDLVKRAPDKIWPVPIGAASTEKAPRFLLTKTPVAYRQLSDNTCVVKSLASALDYIATKDRMGEFKFVAEAIAHLSKRIEGKLLEEALKAIREVMELRAPSICIYRKFNARRRNRLRNNLSVDQLVELQTPFPTLVVPIGADGSISHAITVVDDLIFDSTQKHAFKLCKQSIDWICGEGGCVKLGLTVRFMESKDKRYAAFFHKEIQNNWVLEQN